MFKYLQRVDCGEYCGCQRWQQGRKHQIKSPIIERGSYPTLSFSNQQEYWAWFFGAYSAYGSRTMFDDFCITGCWNWVLDFPERGEFEEVFERYEAATKFGLRPADSFDNAPARLLDFLLVVGREVELARAERAKRNANAKH